MCTCVGLAVLATAVDGLASFRLTLCSIQTGCNLHWWHCFVWDNLHNQSEQDQLCVYCVWVL